MTQPTDDTDPTRAYIAAAEKVILAMPIGQVFINADVIEILRATGWPTPPELRGMGAMLLRLRKRGYVENLGPAASPARSHGGMCAQWRRTDHAQELPQSLDGDSDKTAHVHAAQTSPPKRESRATLPWVRVVQRVIDRARHWPPLKR